jgi:hypothetical protein
MRFSRRTRVIALLMGAWLSLVQSDAGIFHACATGMVQASSSTAAASQATTLEDAHAHHGTVVHVAAATSDHAPSHHPNGDGECHCIGQCCTVTLPALPRVTVFEFPLGTTPSDAPRFDAAQAVVLARVDIQLPYSTAPPVDALT